MELDDDSAASGPAIWLNDDGILLDARELDFVIADRLQDLGGVAPNIAIPEGPEIIDLRSIGHVSSSSKSSLSLKLDDNDSIETTSDVSSSQLCDAEMSTSHDIEETNDEVISNQCNKNRANEYPDLYGSSDDDDNSSSQESNEGGEEGNGHGGRDEEEDEEEAPHQEFDVLCEDKADEEAKEETYDKEGVMEGEEKVNDHEGNSENKADEEAKEETYEEKGVMEGQEKVNDKEGNREGEEEVNKQERWGDEGEEKVHDQQGRVQGKEKPDDDEGDDKAKGGDDHEGKDCGNDDGDDSDGYCVYMGVDKSKMDKTSGKGPEELASLQFFESMGMERFFNIQTWYVMMDVKPDGNCLFYAIIMGLFHQEIEPFYHPTGSNREKLLHLKKNLSDITNFRRQMYTSLLDNCQQFNSKDHNIRSVHNSLGQRWTYYAGDANNLMLENDRTAATLFDDTVDFSQGCTRIHWGDLAQHLPLAAYTHKISIMVYSTREFRRGSDPPFQKRVTDFAHYSEGTVHMHTLITGWYSPPTTVECITLQRVADCHFLYARPKSMSTIVPEDFGVRFKTHENDSSKSCCADDEVISDSKSTQRRVVANPYKKSKKSSSAKNPVQHDGVNGAECADNMGSSKYHVGASRPSALQHVGNASRLLGGKGDMSLFPHYSHEEDINGSKHYRYKHLDSLMFTTTVRAVDLAGMVLTAHDGTCLTMAQVVPHAKTKLGAFFRSEIQKAPGFPEHIAIRGGRVGHVVFGKKGAGKRPKHEFIVYVTGACMGTPKNKRDEVPTRCTTRFIGGINATNLLLLAQSPADSMIEMSISITGSCVHDKNKMYGQIRGVEREEAIREVN